MAAPITPTYENISIHALLAESDYDTYAKVLRVNISIHALLAESDIIKSISYLERFNFYPRSPCGERPVSKYMMKYINKFLSTLSLRRATYL